MSEKPPPVKIASYPVAENRWVASIVKLIGDPLYIREDAPSSNTPPLQLPGGTNSYTKESKLSLKCC